MKLNAAIKKLRKLFPEIEGIGPGCEWSGKSGDLSIHLGNAAEGGEIERLPAADCCAGENDPQEKAYIFGVHRKLAAALEELGYRAEFHDPGTLLAYPCEDPGEKALQEKPAPSAVRTVDITPTWSGLLPAMLAVLENRKAPEESKHAIREQLARMAKAADLYNEKA